jgi:ABC-type dipeptide/oligopeptide/nickel transport system permease component
MTRGEYVLRRALFALATIGIAIAVNFFIFRAAPGNPTSLLALKPTSSPAYRRSLLHEYGLDRSLLQQFGDYVSQLAHGQLGVSTNNHVLVIENLKTQLVNTLPMVALGTIVAIVLGTIVGLLLAWARGTALESGGVTASLIAYSLPTQWIGIVLIIVFAGTLPAGGMHDQLLLDASFADRAVDLLRHMLLPALTLGLTFFAQYALIVRSAMLDVLGEDYMLLARAKGNRPRRLLVRHGLRTALPPIVSLTALQIGAIAGGAVLVELVFSWPGVGRGIAQAVGQRDYPMLQGAFLLLTVSVVLCNFVADLLAVRIDPRVAQ